jgi:alpha-D-xyloside xylohydrolase
MFQFGVLPIFRSHGSDTPREVWEMGEFQPTLVKYDRLRYRLLPYIYSLAWQVTSQGYTMLRGLPMDFPTDRGTHGVADQFLFGPALMVSPVTEYQLHRPPEPSVLVPTASFRTPDGKPGLLARYYKDTAYKTPASSGRDRASTCSGTPVGPTTSRTRHCRIRWEGQLVPSQSGRTSSTSRRSAPPRSSSTDRSASSGRATSRTRRS